MYNLKNVLTQSPDKIKTTVLAIIGVVLALATNVEPTLLETVGAGIALERALDLFYVAPVKKAEEERQLVAVGEAIEDAKKQAPRRQLRIEDEA